MLHEPLETFTRAALDYCRTMVGEKKQKLERAEELFFGAFELLRNAGGPPRETQDSITRWARATFGAKISNARIGARANTEMAELLRELAQSKPNPAKVAEEVADVVIVLMRLLSQLGITLASAVDRKMATNRKRKWVRTGVGIGQHVERKRRKR